MRADNSRFIIQAARDRHRDTLERAREALRRLDRSGEPITFRAVAEAGSVSVAWLYREPTIRAEIERLRPARTGAAPVTLPSAQHASVESLQRRIETTLDEIRRLREENRQLRDRVARQFGERRACGTGQGSDAMRAEPPTPRRQHVVDAETLAAQGVQPERSR